MIISRHITISNHKMEIYYFEKSYNIIFYSHNVELSWGQ